MKKSNSPEDFIKFVLYQSGVYSSSALQNMLKNMFPDLTPEELQSEIGDLIQNETINAWTDSGVIWLHLSTKTYVAMHRPTKPYWWRIFKIRLKLIYQACTARLMYHPKSDGYYLQNLTEAYNEKDLRLAVTYTSIRDGRTWVRPSTEFFDGRFLTWKDVEAHGPLN